jgi:hypothetical protein
MATGKCAHESAASDITYLHRVRFAVEERIGYSHFSRIVRGPSEPE